MTGASVIAVCSRRSAFPFPSLMTNKAGRCKSVPPWPWVDQKTPNAAEPAAYRLFFHHRGAMAGYTPYAGMTQNRFRRSMLQAASSQSDHGYRLPRAWRDALFSCPVYQISSAIKRDRGANGALYVFRQTGNAMFRFRYLSLSLHGGGGGLCPIWSSENGGCWS